WDEADVWALFPASIASDSADLLLGTNGDDQLAGLSGGDELWGYEGDDQLAGGEGDDYLVGGTGRNLIEGGDGNDVISEETYSGTNIAIGGASDDAIYQGDEPAVIAFNSGDGADSVFVRPGYRLTLSLGGIGGERIALWREEQDLLIGASQGNALRLIGYYPGGFWPDGVLQIIEGEVRTYDLNALVQSLDAASSAGQAWDIAGELEAHLLDRK